MLQTDLAKKTKVILSLQDPAPRPVSLTHPAAPAGSLSDTLASCFPAPRHLIRFLVCTSTSLPPHGHSRGALGLAPRPSSVNMTFDIIPLLPEPCSTVEPEAVDSCRALGKYGRHTRRGQFPSANLTVARGNPAEEAPPHPRPSSEDRAGLRFEAGSVSLQKRRPD